jgi:hypothetical protein
MLIVFKRINASIVMQIIASYFHPFARIQGDEGVYDEKGT